MVQDDGSIVGTATNTITHDAELLVWSNVTSVPTVVPYPSGYSGSYGTRRISTNMVGVLTDQGVPEYTFNP